MNQSIISDMKQLLKTRHNMVPILKADGSVYVPKHLTTQEMMSNNSSLIRKMRAEIEKHPQDEPSLNIALSSAVARQKDLLEQFALENGVEPSTNFISLAIDTAKNKFISIPVENITTVSEAIRKLANSIVAAYRRQAHRRNIKLSLELALPHAGSFGFFLIPKITYKPSKGPVCNQQGSLDNLVSEAIIEPLESILTNSEHDEALSNIFDKWGSSVAEDYEKYLKVLSEQDISMSIYSTGFAFYTNKKLADKVLERMSKYMESPLRETRTGKVCGILTLTGKNVITFAPEGAARFEAAFNESLFKDIYALYGKDVEAEFSHRVDRKNISGKMIHHWELLSICESIDNACCES